MPNIYFLLPFFLLVGCVSGNSHLKPSDCVESDKLSDRVKVLCVDDGVLSVLISFDGQPGTSDRITNIIGKPALHSDGAPIRFFSDVNQQQLFELLAIDGVLYVDEPQLTSPVRPTPLPNYEI